MKVDKSGKYLNDRRLKIEKSDDKGGERLVAVSPAVIRLIIKLVKFKKGGYTDAEKAELGEDLLDLALEILGQIKE